MDSEYRSQLDCTFSSYAIANAAILLATLLPIYSQIDIEQRRVTQQGRRVFRKNTMLMPRLSK